MGGYYYAIEFQSKERRRQFQRFPFYGVIPDLNLPLILIDDNPWPKKRARYTSDPLLGAISVTSGNSVSTLNTYSESSQVIVLNSDDPDTQHNIMN